MARPAHTYHHGDLRHAFLVEAAKMVETEGVATLTMRELARRVGVSHAASANHFEDKATLLGELAAEGFRELSVAFGQVRKSKSAANYLRELGRAYVEFALRRPGHYRVMFGRGTMGTSKTPSLSEAGTDAYRVLEAAVESAMPPARARSKENVAKAAFFCWSVVHGAALLMLDGPLAEHDVHAREALIEHVTRMASVSVAE